MIPCGRFVAVILLLKASKVSSITYLYCEKVIVKGNFSGNGMIARQIKPYLVSMTSPKPEDSR
jgi:hypothetical protein